jgi:glycosyltransferase involved in cell wall biosynthesis
MKILVFTHRLELGGTQTNAIDLAAGVRDSYGHDVVLFGTPGPAADLAVSRGLRLLPAPSPRLDPSVSVMAALRRAVAAESPDLIHAWDWPQVLGAFYGSTIPAGIPLLGTSMSMTLERFLPRAIPMTFGTAELRARAAEVWRSPVALLEPPVDTRANHPGAVDPAAFRRQHGLEDGVPTIVIVSRLSRDMKLPGIRRSIGAVAQLAATRRLRLVVVGDGDAFEELSHDAAAVAGRAVVMAGPLADPRPAYAAADIVLGMGGSALRAMAFARPVIVLGENGFSEVFRPETAGEFLWRGFFGDSNGDMGSDRLVRQLGDLLDHPEERSELGEFGRRTVAERFAVDAAAARLECLYREAAAAAPASRPALVAEGVRSLAVRCGTDLVPRRLKRRSLRGPDAHVGSAQGAAVRPSYAVLARRGGGS